MFNVQCSMFKYSFGFAITHLIAYLLLYQGKSRSHCAANIINFHARAHAHIHIAMNVKMFWNNDHFPFGCSI